MDVILKLKQTYAIVSFAVTINKGYWPSLIWGQDSCILTEFFFAFSWTEAKVESHLWTRKKETRPKSNHLDQTSSVNKAFINWRNNASFLWGTVGNAYSGLDAQDSVYLFRLRSWPYTFSRENPSRHLPAMLHASLHMPSNFSLINHEKGNCSSNTCLSRPAVITGTRSRMMPFSSDRKAS